MIRRCTFLFLIPVVLFAQAEQVPIANPVYDFLNRMQIKGEITRYSRAVLPLERKEVTEYLRALQSSRERMSETERALLARYVDEFVAEADGTQDPVVLFGADQSLVATIEESFSDREKFLYQWANKERTTTFFMEFIGTSEYRSIFNEKTKAGAWVGQLGGQFRGTIGGIIGYGLRSTNGTTAGSRDAALSEQDLRQNANYGDWKNNFFDITEAYVSGTWSWGNLLLGKQSLLYGNGRCQRTLVSLNAPPFDALRLNIHVGDFRFAFLHGFLRSVQDTIENQRPFFENKYIALHRAEADILGAVRLGVYEAVIYSQRQIDLAYLNPVNFYKSAEHASGDRDNPMLGFDLQTLNLTGTELYGSWTIDDVDYSRWGSGWWGNKFMWQAGVINQTLIPNTELGLEYSRIEPWTLTHTFRNNEYTNKNESIGFELKPNSDEWALYARHWIGANAVIHLGYQYRRHGLDEYGPDSSVVRLNGGSIHLRFNGLRDDSHAPFLQGPRETTHFLTFTTRYEPYRNLVLDFTYRIHRVVAPSTRSTDHLFSFLLEVVY